MVRIAAAAVVAYACLAAPAAEMTPAAFAVFERIFGDAAHLDPAQVAAVLAAKPGTRQYVDRNGDGKPEEVWFVDADLRHPEANRPVLVRVIDEDGDLENGFEPDLDSDLYIADWRGDGAPDVATDYTDTDGDQDVDEMAFYFPGSPGGKRDDSIMVWWGQDVGDDNLLWYDVGYTYNQSLCQYRTHFGGDEVFCAFTLTPEDTAWVSQFENPFLFYDHDGDGVTEEVIRFQGRNEQVGCLRYSFDADHDATPEDPRDFDVSISAHAPEGLTLPERHLVRHTLRGLPTGPWLDRYVAPQYCRETAWADAVLAWDENDLNMDGANLKETRFTDTQERWEGVIAAGNEWFKQIGGPHVGVLNKRYELASAPRGELRLYYAPVDQRLHLFGADRMWLLADWNFDQQPDLRYEFADTNGDGYIDTWRLDMENDGTADDTWTADAAGLQDVRYTWGEVAAVMRPLMESTPERLYALNARLRLAAAQCGVADEDPVQAFLDTAFDTPQLDTDLRQRLVSSNESIRYYLGLIVDRRICAFKAHCGDAALLESFNALRAAGDLAGMAVLLERAFAFDPQSLVPYTQWRDGLRARLAAPRVDTAQDWVPPNIGWESDLCAYRAYWGQIDFFGKSHPGLIFSTFGNGASYHAEQPWGMDALHVGDTAGLGGVTLYVNGAAYPVRSPGGKGPITWNKGVVEKTDDTITIAFAAENAGPDGAYRVAFHATAWGGKRHSGIEVTVEGGKPEDTIEIGVGLTRLTQETFAIDTQAGVLANWGVQQAAIGTIGLGVLFAPKAFVRATDTVDEHQVVLRAERGKPLRYAIQGDWLRGRRFNRCPTLENWMNELRALATQLDL